MIETTKILQTDLLDLLFDGRNKQYGAYELRKKYNKRMIISVITMMLLCLLCLLLFSFSPGKSKSSGVVIIDTISLAKLPTETKKPEVVPPAPKPIEKQIKTVKLTAPIITDEEIRPDEEMPDKEVLDNTKIGKMNLDGVDDPDAIAPPVSEKGTGVVDEPKKKEDDLDKIYLTVQIESEYPGGISAWQRFLIKWLPKYYTEDLVERGVEGRVMVQFIVDREGNVSGVQSLEGPTELREIAEKVIIKSGKWKPAIQNGHPVKSYKRQPIVFVLEH
jgi:protein TonB